MRTLFSSDFQWSLSSKKRRRYQQSRIDFYEGRNALVSRSSFSVLFNSHDATPSRDTEKPIRFFGLEFGQSVKETIKKLGKPNYKDKRTLCLDKHTTIYYRLMIKQVKCILQMHYYQDQFFFGKMEIRSSNPQTKRDISALVCQKYGISENDWTGAIIDQNSNKVHIKQNMVPSVIYVTGNQFLLNRIKLELVPVQSTKRYSRLEQSELLLDMV
ncbi:hypothetical protein [Roseivirga misakiensis]|uniref:Uncharacterized protein n=1 Tax=Roseivirga misakiensis TaxID=1563681 RepID=A0A1E5SL56_9BACT|nr:hypothetical protein [Roseivirga misakiensis]OEJ99857.1 hypothetical protein BFP71_09920 [Roseivirga misakiensis]